MAYYKRSKDCDFSMKIAFFHELTSGGAKRVVLEYAKELGKNHQIDVYYVSDSADQRRKEFNKNWYHYKFEGKKWQGKDWKTRVYEDSIALIKLYLLHKKIAKDIRKQKYNTIIVHPSQYTQAPFILRFLTNPIYYCQEPLRMVYDSKFSGLASIPLIKRPYEILNRYIRKKIDQNNIRYASLVLANSRFSKSAIERAYDIHVEICYLGVDTNIFYPQNVTKEYDIFFMGNKNRKGEYDLLQEALEKSGMSLRVKYFFRDDQKKKMSDRELIGLYNTARIFVTLTHNEPFGLTALEAMACGVPVIAVNEGGYLESIKDSVTGILVERNAESVCNAITSLIKNNTLRMEMGRNARRHVESHWSLKESTRVLLAYIN